MKSKDYHDYVIKDGKLIGDFESMYQNSEEVPWHQDQGGPDQKIALNLLSSYHFDTIIDIGCGLGYYLDQFKDKGDELIGYDISPTAVEKAQKLFPYEFKTLDLVKQDLPSKSGNVLYTVRGFFWYVFPHMPRIIANFNKLKKGQYILISQNWPPKGSDFVGKEILPNPEALMAYFTEFDPIYMNYHYDCKTPGLNNWFTVLMVRK